MNLKYNSEQLIFYNMRRDWCSYIHIHIVYIYIYCICNMYIFNYTNGNDYNTFRILYRYIFACNHLSWWKTKTFVLSAFSKGPASVTTAALMCQNHVLLGIVMGTFRRDVRIQDDLHPQKLTCPLQRNYFSREYIFQPLIFRGHVSFQGNTTPNEDEHRTWKWWCGRCFFEPFPRVGSSRYPSRA